MGKCRLKSKGSHESSGTATTVLNSSNYDGPTLEEYSEADMIVPRLAARCYHLPGNNWCQDWIQYMRNNHPVLGMFCHHRLHPIRIGTRVVCLIGSIAFGLAATNFVFLYYAYRHESLDDVAFTLHFENNTTLVEKKEATFVVTHGMITLWTVGGALHSIFDLTIWYMSACACCLPGGFLSACGRFRKLGSYFVIVLVAALVAVASFIVVLRASVVSRKEALAKDEANGPNNDTVDWGYITSLNSFSFLLGYLVELGLALYLWFPLSGTLLFSGVFGCGLLPFLGGRPSEIRKEERCKLRDLELERTDQMYP
jgi:hypothetical protein